MSLAPRPSGYPLASGERRPQQLVNAILSLQRGQTNNTGDVTLLINQTSTTVKNVLAGVGQHVFLFPQTLHAAADLASGNLYAPRVTTAGQFTIFHGSSATLADRTFSWMLIG